MKTSYGVFIPPSTFLPESYGAVGNGTVDDTTAIQAAINAAQTAYGVVLLSAKTYAISSPLVISGPVTLAGTGVHPLYGNQATDFNSINIPVVSPFLKGAVLLMTASNQNAINITAVGAAVHLRNFGIRFQTPYVNTGHGIYSVPPAYLTGLDNGILGSRWDNVQVFGHDGNHYAFYIVNPLYDTFTHCHAFGGGGLYLAVNSAVGDYGGCQFDMFYCQLYVNGTSHGIYMFSPASSGGANNELGNFIFNRPQVTVSDMHTTTGATAPSGASQAILTTSGFIYSTTWMAPDFETNVSANVFFPTARGLFVDISGIIARPQSNIFQQGGVVTSTWQGYGLNGTDIGFIPAPAPGAPTTGIYRLGTLHCDSAGTLFMCTVAGTPGTWKTITMT